MRSLAWCSLIVLMRGGNWRPGWDTCAVSRWLSLACRGVESQLLCRWRGCWARVVNPEIIRTCGVPDSDLAAVEEWERAAVDARAARYRARYPRLPLTGRVALVVDDGIATGSTAKAACQIARTLGAARVVLAVPVAPQDWQERMGDVADELVCVDTPRRFFAIGQFYARFGQVSDEEVLTCLDSAAGSRRSSCSCTAVAAAGTALATGM